MTRLDLIKQLPPGTTGLECGVLEGEFSEQILSTPVKMLIMVDCWEHQPIGYLDPANIEQSGQDDRYRRVMEKFDHLLNATVVRAYSGTDKVREVIKQMGPLDWVYIDSNHDFQPVLNDLMFYSGLTNRIFLHDYCQNDLGFRVIEAVDAFLKMGVDWKIKCVTDEEWPTVVLIRI